MSGGNDSVAHAALPRKNSRSNGKKHHAQMCSKPQSNEVASIDCGRFVRACSSRRRSRLVTIRVLRVTIVCL
ncbi:hypothetical protein L596_025118 [Steinernema carpocapsae]|uniref:Uncharacterized protein n=1 Tax=Steinernema carpocapsae TaxID=34508 RepID=A0A4U5M6V9_STECR|nr:hypothetical protein L596_025118 [Steinernema carpocapsae]